jgi:hypothetical protein
VVSTVEVGAIRRRGSTDGPKRDVVLIDEVGRDATRGDRWDVVPTVDEGGDA